MGGFEFADGLASVFSDLELSHGGKRKHSVSVTAYNANNAAIATAANSISVGNCCPLPDAMAAAKVTLNPDFEPRPENYPANTTVPTAVDLAQVGTLGFLNGHGNSLLGKVTGHYTGTTDEILQWASYKWGFDPDITRATAVAESHWHQDDIGDVGNGVSLGILQIKSADYAGTCSPVALNGGNIAFVNDPLCLSHLMTLLRRTINWPTSEPAWTAVSATSTRILPRRVIPPMPCQRRRTSLGMCRRLVQRKLVRQRSAILPSGSARVSQRQDLAATRLLMLRIIGLHIRCTGPRLTALSTASR